MNKPSLWKRIDNYLEDLLIAFILDLKKPNRKREPELKPEKTQSERLHEYVESARKRDRQ